MDLRVRRRLPIESVTIEMTGDEAIHLLSDLRDRAGTAVDVNGHPLDVIARAPSLSVLYVELKRALGG